MMHLAGEPTSTDDTRAELTVGSVQTPLGSFAFAVSADGRVHAAGFTTDHPRVEQLLATRGAACPARAARAEQSRAQGPGSSSASVASALRRYFEDDPAALDPLLVAASGTPFQLDVWRAMRAIPFGDTCSYGELARRVGRPAAVRAVGLACGANPIGLIVPCHRVVGANGKLTGYGAGIARKRWLLAHEANARAAREGLLRTL